MQRKYKVKGMQCAACAASVEPVSYTHLDVYKRQIYFHLHFDYTRNHWILFKIIII